MARRCRCLIQPEDFAAVTHHLGKPDVLLGTEDAIGQRLGDVSARNLPAHVDGAVRGRVTKAEQQRAVFSKHNAMRLVQDTGQFRRDHHPFAVVALVELVPRRMVASKYVSVVGSYSSVPANIK